MNLEPIFINGVEISDGNFGKLTELEILDTIVEVGALIKQHTADIAISTNGSGNAKVSDKNLAFENLRKLTEALDALSTQHLHLMERKKDLSTLENKWNDKNLSMDQVNKKIMLFNARKFGLNGSQVATILSMARMMKKEYFDQDIDLYTTSEGDKQGVTIFNFYNVDEWVEHSPEAIATEEVAYIKNEVEYLEFMLGMFNFSCMD